MTMPKEAFRCLACGATDWLDDKERLACRSCGAEYRKIDGIPILVRDWAEHAREIDEARAVNPGWYEAEQPAEAVSPWRHHIKKRRLYVTGVLERHCRRLGVPRVGRLLDMGCGDGNNLAWLGRFAEQTYGSDYNIVRLTRARHRLPEASLFLADILDYPCADDHFDVIFFNHVIEHITDDVSALRSVHRVLKPGGLLVLGTPNEGAWWWQLAYKRAPDFREATDHVHFYTAKTIGARMRTAGLTVSEEKHMGWGPPDWRLDGRIRQYKLVDDLFEIFGRVFIPRQASSLYMIATKV